MIYSLYNNFYKRVLKLNYTQHPKKFIKMFTASGSPTSKSSKSSKISYDGTVELTNRKVTEKIKHILNTFEIIKQITLMLSTEQKIKLDEYLKERFLFVNLMENDVKVLFDVYNMEMNDVLARYYMQSEPVQEESITKEYYRRLSVENFLPKLDEFAKKAESVVDCFNLRVILNGSNAQNTADKCIPSQSINLDLLPVLEQVQMHELQQTKIPFLVSEAKKELAKANLIDVVFTATKRDYEECSCGRIMSLNQATSELYCPECQEIRENMGVSYEDIANESSRSKSGSYDPNKHLDYWLIRIQAMEKTEFQPEHIEKMKRIISRDSIELTNVHLMRKILKELKLTIYNEHAPLLMKILTGISPPTLNLKLLGRISVKFNRIMELIPMAKNRNAPALEAELHENTDPADIVLDNAKHTKTAKKPDYTNGNGTKKSMSKNWAESSKMTLNRSTTSGNRPYYPHFIYAILNDEIDVSIAAREYDDAAAMTKLKNYIHLQSYETIAKHDSLYKKICELDEKISRDNRTAPLLKFRPTIKAY